MKIRLLYLVFPLAESMARAFCWLFLWNFKQPVSMTQPFLILKEWAIKCLSHKARKRNNWRKNGMFSLYCGDETTTPSDKAFRFYPWLYDRKWLVPYFWLCHKKWSMLFFLKFQRINQKMPYPWSPPRGKPEKKTVFSLNCGDETTTNFNRASKKQ